MTKIDHERIRHFQKEAESWKRLLEYIQQENSYLKNQLADLVNRDIDEEMLGEAEEFQNRFIKKDEMITLMRRDIRDYDDWLLSLSSQCDSDKYYHKQKRLRNEIELLEQLFNKLKFEFLNYIAEKI
jgi:hypothetical protein